MLKRTLLIILFIVTWFAGFCQQPVTIGLIAKTFDNTACDLSVNIKLQKGWPVYAAADEAIGIKPLDTVMGMSQYPKKRNPYVIVHPLDPAESPALSTGHKTGSHRILGISDEFIPVILDPKQLGEMIAVIYGDAMITANLLAKQLRVAMGISSGANILGAIKAEQNPGNNAVDVTVLPERNKKYMSTDLAKEGPAREAYWSHPIQFLHYLPVKRNYEY